MTRVLLTAFEPYGEYPSNASWLALVELTKDLPNEPKVTTRRYPVDFERIRSLIEQDLTRGFDVAIHLGQAPGSTAIRLESLAVNVRREYPAPDDHDQPLCAEGPAAYRATLPLANWAPLLRGIGIPCEVSYHAGTYLCNAALYWNRHLCAQHGWSTRSAFIHLPLEPSQIAQPERSTASMPAIMVAKGLQRILSEIALGRF